MVAIDMEMPSCCYDCDRKRHCEVGIDGGWRTDIRVEGCPLIEIGTCKDCEHWDKVEERCLRLSSDNGWFEDEYYQVYTESDFYCKYFEKRGNDNG